jgi:hypothetical protein
LRKKDENLKGFAGNVLTFRYKNNSVL